MNYLPIFVQIKQRPCLVVGGGPIAARKVALLRKAEGAVTVVSPELCTELSELAAEGKIQHRAKTFSTEDMDDCVLVIAATNQGDVNQQVSALAHEKKLPVNVVDNPDLCS
ncbi:MAG: bifunctional precorrin-2 dehydrogenase/sirohydrochlorin ferrochelatase, partial [Gammaproteobacteria bacterium]|nr:bifunctional precorrin-2 dehydrogenase/sirohydrochlorin ferrochelatase [Gammaproteobacteria bacterium]